MTKLFLTSLMFLSFLSVLSCSTNFKSEPPSLSIVTLLEQKSGKCDYTGYTKIETIRNLEILEFPSFENVTFVYRGEDYKKSKECYGKTLVVQEKKDKDPVTFYFHKLGELGPNDTGEYAGGLLASTRSKEKDGESYFLFKAVKDNKVIDPQPFIRTMNVSISIRESAIRNGVWLAE